MKRFPPGRPEENPFPGGREGKKAIIGKEFALIKSLIA